MAVIKCKMCGGDIELSPDKTFGTCEYCGSTMTLPKIDDEQRAAAFNRGNHFRRIGEFDKALAVYERIVQENDADAEAHWCCALCRFGIEYVEDPASYEWLPTCHRASFDNFLEDVDYLAALEHSDGITRRQYQKDAAKIAEVQRGILATSQNEKPFDVFICYKESDDTGSRTVDSTLAQDIYYQLTEQGRRVFFSRITLEDKAGQEYEPYIFAALHSAKVMLVIGTKPEHFNAVWVKNEWSRYLALMRRDRKRLMIPCYRDMDPYDLPEQLAVLQSYDMSRIGFIQDLIRGVSKVLGTEKAKPETANGTVVVKPESVGNLTALLKRGNMALEDGEWDKADGFFEQVLNMDAECAQAYWGKALATRRCSDAMEFIEREKNVAAPAEGKLVTACPVDEEHIAQAVKDFQIPQFLTEETIRSEFKKFNLSYESMENARRQEYQQEQKHLTSDRMLSRAVRYAKDDEAARVQKTILDIYQARIDEGQRQDKERAAQITQRYTEFLEKTKQEIENRYNAIDGKLSADYAEAAKKQEEAEKTGEGGIEEKRTAAGLLQNTAEAFRMLGPYRNSKERAKECDKAAERLKREAKDLEWESDYVKAAIKQVEAEKTGEGGSAEKFSAARLLDDTAKAFCALGHYRDSEARAEECDKAAERLRSEAYELEAKLKREAEELAAKLERQRKARNKKITAIVAAVAVLAVLACLVTTKAIIPGIRYRHAEALLEAGDSYAACATFRKAGNYKDARSRFSELLVELTVREIVSAGDSHTVGLKSDSTVLVAGWNEYGECDVRSWTDIVAVSAGGSHTVGLKSDGTVVAVGYNGDRQCNVGSWTDIVAVSAGEYHTVGLKSDGTVVAVGYNGDRQCDVGSWTDIVAVSAGEYHTVGLKSDGTVVAAGSNGTNRCDVGDWTDIVAVSAGGSHTVGLRSDGTAVAVGSNGADRCDVGGWADIFAVSAGGSHTVGLKSDGTVLAVGANNLGQCDVGAWKDIVSVSAGKYHTVGLKSDGTVVAVGYDYRNQCDVSGWTGLKTMG